MSFAARLPPYEPAQAELWMRLALDSAREARDADEVPVGCIVVDPAGNVTGRAGDTRQANADPWGHAEIHAIRQAASVQGDWRLDRHTLIVTLEPCPMCAGLILMARIGRVIFGAPNHKWGAAGTRADWLRESPFPHRPEVHGGILSSDCAHILSEYFAARRGASA
jgi:tRNA(adenine34) deaminase